MLTVIRPLVYGLLMWGVFIYAFRRGGWAEKVAATGIVINAYLSWLLVSPSGSRFRQVEVEIMDVDLGLLVLLVLVSLRSRRFWPMWLAALQGVSTLAHFAPYIGVMPTVYHNAVALWSYPILIVLALAIRHSDRRGVVTAAGK